MNGIKTMWIAVAAVAVVALFIVGYSWGATRTSTTLIGAGGDYASGYSAGVAAAKQKLTASGLIPPSPATVTIIAGTVNSVDTDKFIIRANPVSLNPLDEQGPAVRTVVVNKDTQFIANVPMTPDESAAAMKLFQDNMKAGKTGAPPLPYTEKTVDLSAIKIGMVVTITSTDDIKLAGTINAKKVTFDALPSTNPTK